MVTTAGEIATLAGGTQKSALSTMQPLLTDGDAGRLDDGAAGFVSVTKCPEFPRQSRL